MTAIVVNRQNNFGDAMNQMRILKEWKESTGIEMDFVSNIYLHYIAANHTDLFRKVMFEPDINAYAAGWQSKGYDRMIEFTVDWGRCCEAGLMRAWAERTLNFVPSTDKPYFQLTDEEKVTALSQHGIIMTQPQPNKPTFRKSMVLNLESVSAGSRGFQVVDFNRFADLIPPDVAIYYFAPITWIHGNPFTPRPNLIVLAGYPMGHMGGLMQLVDFVMVVHSGPLMMAHAVDAKCIVEINFNEGGSPALISPPKIGEKYCIENNRVIDWSALQTLVNKYAL